MWRIKIFNVGLQRVGAKLAYLENVARTKYVVTIASQQRMLIILTKQQQQ